MTDLMTVAAQAAEEGGGTQVNLVVIALVLAAIIGAVVYARRKR